MDIFIIILLTFMVVAVATPSSIQNPVLVTQVIAGSGILGYNGENMPATAAQLFSPYGVWGDPVLDVYYVADVNRIRKISSVNGILVVNTYAGVGSSTSAVFNEGCQATASNCYISNAIAVWVDSSHNVYFSDTGYQKIKKIDYVTGTVTTAIGSGLNGYNGENQPATLASLAYVSAVWGDSVGNIYFSETNNHRVRKYVASTGLIITIAGTGTGSFNGNDIPATTAYLYNPQGVYGDESGNKIYITETSNHRIRVVDQVSGLISTFAGTGNTCYNGDGIPAVQALLCSPVGLFIDNVEHFVYFVDSNNLRLRMVNINTGYIYNVAGNGGSGAGGDGGPPLSANLFARSVWGWGNGADNLLLPDSSNKRIRTVDSSAGYITRFAGIGNFAYNGDGLTATLTQLYYPTYVWVSSTGVIYVADSQNYRIRKLSPAGSNLFTTVVGTGVNGNSGGTSEAGTSHYLGLVAGIWGDTNGFLYYYTNYYIEKYNPNNGIVAAVVGVGGCCYNGNNYPALSTYLSSAVRGIFGDGQGKCISFFLSLSFFLLSFISFRKLIFC
jgi:hypothetical protein